MKAFTLIEPLRPDKYILIGTQPQPENDFVRWVKWMEENDRRVRLTRIGFFKPIRVNTVFLGLDHSFGCGLPLLFETMVFKERSSDYYERYVTWEQAVAGHEEIVKHLRCQRKKRKAS